jgi:hypothetical protein
MKRKMMKTEMLMTLKIITQKINHMIEMRMIIITMLLKFQMMMGYPDILQSQKKLVEVKRENQIKAHKIIYLIQMFFHWV